jgi:hypothetical protein
LQKNILPIPIEQVIPLGIQDDSAKAMRKGDLVHLVLLLKPEAKRKRRSRQWQGLNACGIK